MSEPAVAPAAAPVATPTPAAAPEAAPAGETLATGTQPDATEAPSGEAEASKPASAAPETYTFQAPEGRTLDEGLVAEVTPLFKESGLSQEAAQKVVDVYFKAEAQQAALAAKQAKDWAEEVKADPNVGGEHFEVSTRKVQAVVQKYAGDDLPALQEMLSVTGFGNHPALFRTFHRIAAALGEDSVGAQAGSPAADSEEAFLAKMYPTMSKQE